jgi:hypothetical protein
VKAVRVWGPFILFPLVPYVAARHVLKGIWMSHNELTIIIVIVSKSCDGYASYCRSRSLSLTLVRLDLIHAFERFTTRAPIFSDVY